MKRGHLSLAAVAVAALALTACGDDDGGDEIDIPETLPDVSLPDVTLPEITIPDISLPGGSLPDISLPDVTMPDISLPESLPDSVIDALNETFPNLDETQIECLLELSGGEIPGPELMNQLQEECDISLQDLMPGGG